MKENIVIVLIKAIWVDLLDHPGSEEQCVNTTETCCFGEWLFTHPGDIVIWIWSTVAPEGKTEWVSFSAKAPLTNSGLSHTLRGRQTVWDWACGISCAPHFYSSGEVISMYNFSITCHYELKKFKCINQQYMIYLCYVWETTVIPHDGATEEEMAAGSHEASWRGCNTVPN